MIKYIVPVLGGLWPLPCGEGQYSGGGAQCAPRQGVLKALRGKMYKSQGKEGDVLHY